MIAGQWKMVQTIRSEWGLNTAIPFTHYHAWPLGGSTCVIGMVICFRKKMVSFSSSFFVYLMGSSFRKTWKLALHFNCFTVLEQDEIQLFKTLWTKGYQILFLRRVIKIRVPITLWSRVKTTCTSIFIFIFIVRKKFFVFFFWKEGVEKGTVLAKYCTFEHHSFPSQ